MTFVICDGVAKAIELTFKGFQMSVRDGWFVRDHTTERPWGNAVNVPVHMYFSAALFPVEL